MRLTRRALHSAGGRRGGGAGAAAAGGRMAVAADQDRGRHRARRQPRHHQPHPRREARRQARPVVRRSRTTRKGAGAVAQLTRREVGARRLHDGDADGGLSAADGAAQGPPFDPLDGFSFVTLVCGYPMVYAVAPGFADQVVCRSPGAGQDGPGPLTYTINALGSIYHVLTKWIEHGGRDRAHADPLSRHRAGAERRARRPGRLDGGRRDLGVPAHRRAASCACSRCPSAAALSADAERADRRRDVAEDRVHVVARPRHGGRERRAPIVERLNQEVRAALALPDVQQRLVEGGNVATPSTPEEMRQKVASEMARWRTGDRDGRHQGGMNASLCTLHR